MLAEGFATNLWFAALPFVVVGIVVRAVVKRLDEGGGGE